MGLRLRPGWTGLAASVAVHAALFAFLVLREPPAAPAAAPPIEIEVVSTRLSLAAPTPRPAQLPAPAPSPTPRPARPPVATARPRPAPPSATSTPGPSTQSTQSTGSTQSIASTNPAVAAPTDLPRASRLDLSLRAEPAARVPVLREQLRLGPGLPVERAPSELISEGQARRRVENGLVDPYFAQLGKALIDHWDAEAHVRRAGVRGWMQQIGENSEMFTAIWQKNARRYASAGSPLDDSSAGAVAVPAVVDRTGALSSAAAREAYGRQLKEQFTARKRALFRVVQNHDGTLRSVTLVEGSNEPAIDRAALEDVRAAASRLPPPPQEGLGIKEPIVSVWEFQLTVSISPPVPSVTIEFDEALAFLDVRMPLDRRIYKRVKLVSVE